MTHAHEDGGMRAYHLAGLVPELAPPFARTAPVRIPELRNVALTRRVLRVIDHPDFQRLRSVLQLGPTHLVYPGAMHTRFEHSIGVFENYRSYLVCLLGDRSFAQSLTEEDILTGLAAALLHDIGHYPFAHSLEALHYKGMEAPHHENLARDWILGKLSPDPIARILEKDWHVDPDRVVSLINRGPGGHSNPVDAGLSSILHSPIDADKMDYLERDSIHMGVPYGRNYDRDRLLSTLRIHPGDHTLAVTDKGKISAEIFIFCRYTMFSEAYWHHTVRSASAMVERALEDFRESGVMDGKDLLRLLLTLGDAALLHALKDAAPPDGTAHRLMDSLAGNARRLYKRVLTLSRVHRDATHRQAYENLYQLDRAQVHEMEGIVRRTLSRILGRNLHPADVIIDTPPPGKDRIEDIHVLFEGSSTEPAPLSSLSRIVEGISTDFAKVVKKIRVFVEPDTAREAIGKVGREGLAERLLPCLTQTPSQEKGMQETLF